MENSVFLTERSIWNSHAKRHRNGKIKVGIQSKSGIAMKILGVSLILLTIYAFMTFDYKDIDFFDAVSATFHNIKAVFLQPKLSRDSVSSILYQLLITFCLGVLSTVFGAVLAFFCSLLCAKNISSSVTANIIKSIVALVRAVPTVLWVLIFAVSAGGRSWKRCSCCWSDISQLCLSHKGLCGVH